MAVIALGISGGCTRSRPAPTFAPLPIDVVGCRAIRKTISGSVCELVGADVVRAVLPPGATDARVRAGEAQTPDAGVDAREDGVTLTIAVPPSTTTLVVTALIDGRSARGAIDIAMVEPTAWLDDARKARSSGEIERARGLAAAHASDVDPVARAHALGLLARIELAAGRSDGALPLFRQAIGLHRAAGRVSDAADDSFALAFALHQRSQKYTEARAVLDELTPDVALYAEGRARAPYYRGVLAAETGDRRRALTLLREAERAARRLGMIRLERNARSALALELQEIGRAKLSLPVLRALESEFEQSARDNTDPPSACERVEVANNLGWGALLVNEVAVTDGEPAVEDARGPLERALAIRGCSDTYVRGFALANLARLALAEGDLAAAERRLGEARAGVREPRGTERIAWLDLEGQLLLARGKNVDALRVLDDALAHARASVLRLQEWSLLVSRGEVLESLGRLKEAITTLQAAEDVLDDATLLVPLGEGRGAFAGGRARSARALFGLLVKTNQLRAAAAMAKRAQARVLASVERGLRLAALDANERARWEAAVHAFRAARSAIDADAADDWKLPADALERATKRRAERERELRAALDGALLVLDRPRANVAPGGNPPIREDALPAPGVLELTIYPDARGFVVIAMAGPRAITFRVGTPSRATNDELARALLDPVDDTLARMTTVRVRAYGAWRAVDVHALASHGQPLLARVAVEYSLGLVAPPQLLALGHTLIVGDPTSDLPGALAEARDAAETLRAQARASGDPKAYRDVRLLVRDDATSSAVAAALRGAGQLHYAGHGIFAGDEGWESALPLAAGGRLTVGDVLALAPAPPEVVLTGCEAARSVGEAEGIGLAQAFIVAGSSDVLAPVRRIADTLAARLTKELYGPPHDAGAPSTRMRLSTRARDAILAVRKDEPDSDWAAFRVLVP